MNDLRGKNVSVGSAGSGTEANARQILNASGITYDDISEVYLSFSESADAYKDGQVDILYYNSRCTKRLYQILLPNTTLIFLK